MTAVGARLRSKHSIWACVLLFVSLCVEVVTVVTRQGRLNMINSAQASLEEEPLLNLDELNRRSNVRRLRSNAVDKGEGGEAVHRSGSKRKQRQTATCTGAQQDDAHSLPQKSRVTSETEQHELRSITADASCGDKRQAPSRSTMDAMAGKISHPTSLKASENRLESFLNSMKNESSRDSSKSSAPFTLIAPPVPPAMMGVSRQQVSGREALAAADNRQEKDQMGGGKEAATRLPERTRARREGEVPRAQPSDAASYSLRSRKGQEGAEGQERHEQADRTKPSKRVDESPVTSESNEGGDSQVERIQVCVRKRPVNTREQQSSLKDVVRVPAGGKGKELMVLEYKKRLDLSEYVEQHDFAFDEVLSDSCSNDEVYERTTKSLVRYVFNNKGKATVFAYGQTGAGKTYTMMGGKGQKGLYLLAAQDIFSLLEEKGRESEGLGVTVSFFEIYGGKLFDLLAERKPCVKREDGNNNVFIRGLSEHVIGSAEDLMHAIQRGHQARSTAATEANIDSSRSHAILQVCLRKMEGKGQVVGKLSFIDLAGSERAGDTGRNGNITRRLEAAEINKSLLALKECIRALAEEAKHIPFRGSVLTSVLKDSFIGNCRTVMIANVAPTQETCEHTMNTLRYADRVKQIKRNASSCVFEEEAAAQDDWASMMDSRRSIRSSSMAERATTVVTAMAACRSARGSRTRGKLTTSPEEEQGKHEEDLIQQLASLHRRHIQDTSALLQKEREILARVERNGPSASSYLSGLGKLLQHKSGMVSRMLEMLSNSCK
ncbi:kinesin-like protein [Guillardia theta CCMP2712]|uniref:Kinesin-like protein n=1 Tax=Guillardia theta (strain CCMP2712) TaxID=905079 RepID=L1J0U5_GUITC|nr:kinesin-like protein [Guillardia theta CCMP2712]EKX42136.1 kinesin-like protein [Guillardia theta CCMP2712]|eukprot:XP_005829116.1 kinesin-like protein [Guillardia theta CCMP2712]